MSTRADLSMLLHQALGTNHVYFQPPESTKLQFPCIVYSLDAVDVTPADNIPYLMAKRYKVTLISKDPDEPTFDRLLGIPYSRFVRYYASDNLNHWQFNIYN